ncbi:uncharacterized protein F5147DRAFT_576953 [Suillus discolor]|uniref:Integrase core domain-containing protein n=1 Tax=Suillus discolor TaxID=1912936 RepID=A0A9P7F635_9AGAM|nr:uncharacterized protein F5147DRAFT_576953 [Suillus discolor]KAG2108391.1 hypothetical protein F5147DRAFT_576953 [Suillus discolor]
MIDPEVLAVSYQLQGPTELGEIFGVSARTVRCRALEQKLVQPGEPVYITYVDEDGQAHRVYQSSTGSQSTLSDEELDATVLHILNLFPTFGRRMIDGHLLHLRQHVPRSHVQASYARVNGPPVAAFGVCRISRRVYNVAGYNSLAHHDGQHGESVHIIRIKWLWVDWTSMVGSKWKSFFQDLEVTGGLNPDNTAHIWLLHHLFLPLINHKAIQWANAWNMHKMALPDGQQSCSPADLRWFSILQSGAHGFDAASFQPPEEDLDVDEIDEYGINWEAYEDQHIQAHHTEGNQPDHLGHNPFVAH